jgi:hypothetical protein
MQLKRLGVVLTQQEGRRQLIAIWLLKGKRRNGNSDGATSANAASSSSGCRVTGILILAVAIVLLNSLTHKILMK